MSHRSRLTLTALSLVAASALAPQAQASGFQLREQSPLALGNAFAGVSAGGGDITAMYFNPAVLTQFDGWQMSFGGTFLSLNAKIENASATRTPILQGLGFNVAPVGGAALRPISGSPSHPNAAVSAPLPEFNVMYSVNKDLKIGLGLNVPFGLATEYDANWIGRYHALKTDLKTIDISPTIAYRVSPEFSFGVAFIARRADAEISSALDYGTALALKVGPGLAAAGLSTAPVGPGLNSPVANVAMGAPNATFGTPGFAIPGAWDGTAGMKGGAWGYGYKAGVTYENQSLKVGLSYNAAMTMNLKGDATFTYPATMPATDLAALQGAGLRNGGGTAELALPATTSLGIDYKVSPTFSIAAEVSQSTWSRFKELRLKFDTGAPDSITDESWKNTTFVSIGGTWRFDQAWTFRAGLAFDSSAVDETHRTPRIPDNDRKWLSLGGSYAFSKKTSVDFGYTHLFITDGKMALTTGTTSDTNTTRGSLNGTIVASINMYGVAVRYSF